MSTEPTILFCWCVPPGTVYAICYPDVLCTWPDCPNGQRGDPADHDPPRLED